MITGLQEIDHCFYLQLISRISSSRLKITARNKVTFVISGAYNASVGSIQRA